MLANLRGDLCLREDSDDRGYTGTGTWEALHHDDATWRAFADRYRAAGHVLLPAALVLAGYQEQRRSDLTHDMPELIRRLDRAHAEGFVVLLGVDLADEKNGCGDTLARLPGVLRQLRGHVAACMTGFEIVTDAPESKYTYGEHERVLQIIGKELPDAVRCVEFAGGQFHDGRSGLEEPDFWTRGYGQLIDVLLYEHNYQDVEDPQRATIAIGGVTSRVQGLFPIPATWPDGSPLTEDVARNWRADYGVYKPVVAFEYASFLRWPSSRKRSLREWIQGVVPIAGYCEG